MFFFLFEEMYFWLPSRFLRTKMHNNLYVLNRRRDNAQWTFLSKLIVGEIDSPELLARVNINVPPRVFRNYRLIKTDLTRRAYSENDPRTAMACKFNQCYILFDWHLPTRFC